jgi:hypothetical protein
MLEHVKQKYMRHRFSFFLSNKAFLPSKFSEHTTSYIIVDFKMMSELCKAQWLLFIPPCLTLRSSVFCLQSVLIGVIWFSSLSVGERHFFLFAVVSRLTQEPSYPVGNGNSFSCGTKLITHLHSIKNVCHCTSLPTYPYGVMFK